MKEYFEKENQVNMLLFYHYVDLNDYENPIKMLLDDILYIPLETDHRTEVNVFY